MTEPQFEPDYLVALDEIYHCHWAARKRRKIALLKQALDHFWPNGHPTKLIQVTGTNGKGSVSHYLEQGFGAIAKAGSWTGPHVFDYAERFHIEGKKVAHKDIARIYKAQIRPYQMDLMERKGESLGFAPIGILICLHLFEAYQVAWGIMEVGAGGRYTPLMACDMVACVLTNIGYDHPKSLGSESWQRAMEKAGIARKNIPFFSAELGEAQAYVVASAAAEGAPVLELSMDLVEEMRTVKPEDPEFSHWNRALAVQVIQHFAPEQDAISLAKRMETQLPARFQMLAPNILIDMAHNDGKIGKLAEKLQKTWPNRKFRFLVGLTRSRQPVQVFQALFPMAEYFVFTNASHAGQPPDALANQLREAFPDVRVCADPHEALKQEKDALDDDAILVLTGSAYMIDQALNENPYIRHTNGVFGWRTAFVDDKALKTGGTAF